MSPKIYSLLASSDPDFLPAIKVIRLWLAQNPQAKYVDLRSWNRLFKRARVSNEVSASVLDTLIASGQYALKYAVAGPDNTIRSDLYDELTDIPDKVRGPFNTYFDADDGYVLSVLVESPAASKG